MPLLCTRVLDPQISYDGFRKKLSFYWSQNQQNVVKYKFNFGKFDSNGSMDLVEYCIELGRMSKLLDAPLHPKEFIETAVYSGRDQECFVTKPQNFEELIALLR